MELSVVAASRNDDHGGKLLHRMNYFVSGFVKQCKRHHLKAELILVEWNPPDDKPPLKEALTFPKDLGPCSVRIITVPKKAHATLAHSSELPLFQMIAKNVGIRRAQGKFVLATNIDILFSDALMAYLKENLQEGYLYRVDRLDVPSELPPLDPFDDLLTFCDQRYFRIHGHRGSTILKDHQWGFLDKNLNHHQSKVKFWLQKLRKFHELDPLEYLQKLYYRVRYNAHTNACGDFTLLSKSDWETLRGYPEFEGFSWHLDSLFIYQALKKGFKQVILPRKYPIYHIEHLQGSGFTPEKPKMVFERIEEKKIPCISDRELLKKSRQLKSPYLYNESHWGFNQFTLEDNVIHP